MTRIEWSDGFSVGVAEIDDQHKKLVEMLNDLAEAASGRAGGEAAGPVIEGLKEYAGYHFATEEQLMRKYGYPDRAAHKKEHALFLERVAAHEALVGEGQASVYDLWMFLRSWLLDHIMGVDVDLGRFLSGKGVA